MYFRNAVCTVALATLASAAVAKQIPTPYSTDEAYEDAVDEVFERDAEAEAARTAAWEQVHGGAAPSYHYGEEHDASAWHVARDAEAEPGWKHNGQPPAWLANLKSAANSATDAVKNAVPTAKPFTKQSGGLKKHHGGHKLHGNHGTHTRDVEEEEDDEFENDPNLPLWARDFENDPVPDFGDLDVDTSLEGLLEARDVNVEDDEEVEEPENPDLSGYDSEVLERRADGTADEIDYSLDGYEGFEEDEELDPIVQARSLNEDDDMDYDTYLRSEEHRALLESVGVTKRDAEDDAQDEAEFDEQLYANQQEGEFLHESYDGGLAARGVIDEDFPEHIYDEDDAFSGELEQRDVDQEELDIPEGVDTSLEGLTDGPIFARGVEEDVDDDDDEHDNSDAAYDGVEVAEELVAPVLG
jgi:hypothetical protein